MTYRINKFNRTGTTFMMIDKAEFIAAAKELNGNTFKVWAFLMSNEDGYSTDHMQKFVQDNLDMDKTTVSRAFKEMEAVGYIKDGVIYSYNQNKARPEPYVNPKVAGRKVDKMCTNESCGNVNSELTKCGLKVDKTSTQSCQNVDTNKKDIKDREDIRVDETATANANAKDASASAASSNSALAINKTEKRCFKSNYRPWKGKELNDDGSVYDKQELTYKELYDALWDSWDYLFEYNWTKEHPKNEANVKKAAETFWNKSGTWKQQKDLR